ncbi:MAG: PKD domain-containing protein [Bacteroidia bacterium]|nr:PKD domain-containing protein [Bacteroidia bacterium]
MKKSITITVACLVVLFTKLDTQAQCLSGNCFVNITPSATTICEGQSVSLSVDTGSALLFNNFNSQTLGAGWTVNPGTVVNYNNPCGPGMDGSPHVWFGAQAPQGTRFLATVDFNTTAGGFIQFDFKMATQGNGSPCEGPDEVDEGVSLQYSNDYGATWIDITYFSPDGTFYPSNPCPNCSGGAFVAGNPFLSWATYTFNFPAAAQTPCTRFRWTQPYNTSATNDHWGIDNVLIYANIPPVPGFVNTATWLDTGDTITGPRVVSPTVTTSYIAKFETGAGTCYDTVTINVNPKPVASLTGPSNLCVNTPYVFSGAGSTVSSGTINNYRFIMNPNGATNQVGPNSNLSFTYPVNVPTFQASLVVTTAAGCSDTAYLPITVSPKPVPLFTMQPAVCEGTLVNLDASATNIAAPGVLGYFVWDTDGDNISDDSLAANQNSFLATGPGTHNVKLTVYNSVGCATSVTHPITIHPQPVADFTAVPGCIGAAAQITNNNLQTGVNYNWDFGDGTTLLYNGAATGHIYTAAGSYTIELVADQQGLCSDTMTQTISVQNTVDAAFSFNDPCDLNGIFTDLSTVPPTSAGTINSWYWDFADGNSSAVQNPVNLYTDNGDYNVVLIVGTTEGCFDTLIQTVPRYAKPVADFAFSEVCLGQVSKLANTSTVASGTLAQYSWDLGNGVTLSTPDGDHSYDNAGAYQVTLIVVSDRGCSDTVSHSVNVWPVPTADFTTLPLGQTTMLEPTVELIDQSSGATAWEWYINNVGTFNGPNPVFEFPASGSYSIVLTVSNQYGCEDQKQSDYIVLPSYTFYVPNSFTPNEGDLFNPVFQVYSRGLSTIDFRVFSRWGDQVFQSSDPEFIWDGTFKGKDLPPDAYAYRCVTRDVEGNEYIYYGHINLIR